MFDSRTSRNVKIKSAHRVFPVYRQRFLSQKSRHGEISCLDVERWTMPWLNLRVEGNGCEWDRFPCCSEDEFKCITKHLDHCGRWTRKRVFLESRGQLKFNGNLCRCRVQMQKMLIFISRIILKGWWTGFHWLTDNDHENRRNWKQF